LPNFKISKNTNISVSQIEVKDLYNKMKSHLSTYYSGHSITVGDNGIAIRGNLKATFERAITKADISVVEQNGFYAIKAQGSSSIGFWSWVWLLLSFFTGFFFIWFLFDFITFLIGKDRPRAYITEAIDAVVSDVSFGNQTPNRSIGEVEDATIERLEKIAILRDKGVLSEEEFQVEKGKIIS